MPSQNVELSWKGYGVKDTQKPFDFELVDFEPKKLGDYDVDIAIVACGVCSSDTHTITGGWGELAVKPVIPGHEAAGIVKNVGSKVKNFKVGDRAGVGAQVWSCLDCDICKSDNENYCPKQVATYNQEYPDGSGTAHGGYAGAIRVHEHYVFAIPDEFDFKHVGPMLCAGLTVYSPLVRNGCGPGKKVGIAGIGGLGHLAVQLAKALGAEVYAFTHQADKIEDAKKMGADHVIDTTKKDFAEPLAFKLDLIICTIDVSKGIDLTDYMSMLNIHKHFICVAMPDDELPPFKSQALAANGARIGGSHIGSSKECREMLKLAAAKNVRPWIQEMPMSKAGEANKAVKENTVRYRGVLMRDF